MSPTVLSEGGYQVRIYPKDHPPAHVHVWSAGNEIKVQLDPVEVMGESNTGFNSREVTKIIALIEKNQESLLLEWDKYHKSR